MGKNSYFLVKTATFVQKQLLWGVKQLLLEVNVVLPISGWSSLPLGGPPPPYPPWVPLLPSRPHGHPVYPPAPRPVHRLRRLPTRCAERHLLIYRFTDLPVYVNLLIYLQVNMGEIATFTSGLREVERTTLLDRQGGINHISVKVA